jgi:hypothetical protein
LREDEPNEPLANVVCLASFPFEKLADKKDPEKAKNNSELTEATQNAQNGSNRQRKGKNSKFPKLSENGMIAKSALQDF